MTTQAVVSEKRFRTLFWECCGNTRRAADRLGVGVELAVGRRDAKVQEYS